jgi:hypothetical protein
MINLLPCPCCNSTTGKLIKTKTGYVVVCEISTPSVWILHKDERCEEPNVCTDVYGTPEEAVKNWNWRLASNIL